MPTNEELQEQINQLREQVAENKQTQKDRWSDSPWAIALQSLIAIAAVAIAWAQFNAAAIQTELSSKQTGLQEFEIIKSLSSLNPDDSLEVNTLFDYISTLDEDLQQRFLNNNLDTKSVNYFGYKSYDYLFQNFAFDTVAVIGGMMEKLGTYMATQRMNEIANKEVALADNALMDNWVDMIMRYTKDIGFQSRKTLISQHSKEFVNGVMILRKIINHQSAKTTAIEKSIEADTSLIFQLVPYDSRLISGIFGMGSSTPDLRPWLSKVTIYDLGGHMSQVSKLSDRLFEDYRPDRYQAFLRYLSAAKNFEDYLKYLSLCLQMMDTQDERHDDLAGLSFKVALPGNDKTAQKKISSSYRLWFTEDDLSLLKRQFDDGMEYHPDLIKK